MHFGFRNISVRLGKNDVIQDLSLEVPKGKITTLIGKNGAGKSTLLKTVCRVVKPDAGQVVLEDRDIRKADAKQIAKRIAYLSQVHDVPSDIDVETLVSYGRFPHKKFGSGLTQADQRVIDSVIENMGLTPLKNRAVRSLSGGERQRAWIAMTLCQEPEILILDEPITYLDVGYRIEILELIRRLNRRLQMTIFMVLHDLNLAAKYSDELVILERGKIANAGTPEEILTQENLLQYFNIHTQIYRDPNGAPYYVALGTNLQET